MTAGYAFGRYARLPLTSELDALCTAYVNRILLRLWLAEPSSNPRSAPPKERKNGIPNGIPFSLEVQAGFEPADNGVADRGLTTWLLHQILIALIL